jgi:hypothetical protein
MSLQGLLAKIEGHGVRDWRTRAFYLVVLAEFWGNIP